MNWSLADHLRVVLRLAWCLGVVAVLSCDGAPEEVVPETPSIYADFVTEFHHGITTPLNVDIDIGDEAARPYLSKGWGADEVSQHGRKFAWGKSGVSVVELPLSEQGPIELLITARAYAYKDAPPQMVGVKVNSVLIKRVHIKAEWDEVRVAIPSGRLHAGLNRFEFVYSHTTAPNEVSKSKDARRLAVSWDRLRFVTTQQPRAHEASNSVFVPFGTTVSFPVVLPPSSTFFWEGIDPAGSERGVLGIALVDPATGAIDVHELDGGTKTDVLTAADAEPKLHRLVLSARPPADDPLARGGLTVRSASIQGPPGVPPEQEVFPRRPNVIVYLVDTLRADHLGCYGYERPTSPNIDTFAKESVLFEQTIAESPWTRSSIATILTGLYPQTHNTIDRMDRIPDAVRTLPLMMSDAGYATAGVTTNGNVSQQFNFERGYDYYRYLPESLTGPVHHDAGDVNADVFRWLDRRPHGRPFFLYVHVSDPHGPYTPPQRFRRRFAPEVPEGRFGSIEWLVDLHRKKIEVTPKLVKDTIRLYDAEIAYMDEHFGHFVDGLKRRDLYDDSMIIVVSDHGEEFYEHRDWEHGTTLYSEVLQVPLIMKYPYGSEVETGRVRQTTQLIDIAPTVLEVTGLPSPEGLPGTSLYNDEVLTSTEKRVAYSHLDMYKTAASIEDGEWKFIRFQNPESTLQKRLYDQATDRGDKKDLFAQKPELSEKLEKSLDEHIEGVTTDAPSEEATIDSSLEERLKVLGYLQ